MRTIMILPVPVPPFGARWTSRAAASAAARAGTSLATTICVRPSVPHAIDVSRATHRDLRQRALEVSR